MVLQRLRILLLKIRVLAARVQSHCQRASPTLGRAYEWRRPPSSSADLVGECEQVISVENPERMVKRAIRALPPSADRDELSPIWRLNAQASMSSSMLRCARISFHASLRDRRIDK